MHDMARLPATSGDRPLSLRSLCAAGGVALVLMLSVFAASPALHHWLHGDGSADAGDSCAVVLFASGVTLAAGVALVAAEPQVWREAYARPIGAVFVASPRHLRHPERGPPIR
jgi:hypothetical protein